MAKPFGVVWFVSMALLAGCGSDDKSDQPVLGPCSSAEPFCQKYKGHAWSDPKPDLSFEDAKAYCASIKGRLPTISELRTLIAECAPTEPGGACKVTDTCISETECGNGDCSGCGDGGDSVFHSNDPFWSSTPVTDPLSPNQENTNQVWNLIFRYSAILPIDKSHTDSVFCIAP